MNQAAEHEQNMCADFTRTCEGCEHAVEESGVKAKAVYRCMAYGRWQGYTIGREHFLPYIPAWCPKRPEKTGDDA